ncbi:MAG: hypothetical protein EOQ41_33150, partial [Mesorhizobium sp.]
MQLPFIGDRAFLSVAEDEAAAERAFVALPSADLFSPIISQETAILVRPDTLVAISRIAGGTVVENHSLIWALEGSAGALLLVGRASGLASLPR